MMADNEEGADFHREGFRLLYYLPTMVLNGVGDIASMAKAKEE